MANYKKKKKLGDLLTQLKSSISSQSSSTGYIPDIITFCESPEWLGLANHPTNPIVLYPMQKTVLKAFYRGTIGNENIELSEEEITACEELGLDNNDRGNLLGKYHSGELFNELVLVWGRRSGKDFLVSIIALYEAMKILECPGGDPYQLYELSSSAPINILTVANSKEQAGTAFKEIREKLLFSNYFADKYIKEGVGKSSIYLLTPQDKKDNIEFKEKGLPPKRGSVGVIVGHSNSDTLLGIGCIVLILDEVASYKKTGGSSSGDRIYSALTPTVTTYCRREYFKDEKGNFKLDEHGQKIVSQRFYDGKVISISSPRAKEGKFYDLFITSPQSPRRLTCRLPTWDVNPTHTRESLREQRQDMSEAEFLMEFGAEFSGTGAQNFFTEEQVNKCFVTNIQDKAKGEPGKVYFAHIDPATSSHNYALVILHKEYYLNKQTKESEYNIIVDHIKFWEPTRGPIDPDKVLEYIIGLKRRFHIGLLTYDQWTSRESIKKLRKNNIPNKLTRFNNHYKYLIYGELEDLINLGRIKIPYHHVLRQEMIELQRKYTEKGFKVFPKSEGDGQKTDDIVDCLAAATYNAVDHSVNKLPSSHRVSLGAPSSNQVLWRSMQGTPYGYGTGQQVSSQLERRNSWPNRKR